MTITTLPELTNAIERLEKELKITPYGSLRERLRRCLNHAEALTESGTNPVTPGEIAVFMDDVNYIRELGIAGDVILRMTEPTPAPPYQQCPNPDCKSVDTVWAGGQIRKGGKVRSRKCNSCGHAYIPQPYIPQPKKERKE